MSNNTPGNYVKIATPIRTMKSEVGQVRVGLFNDQISLSIAPAVGKTDFGTIKYNGNPQTSPNIRFSVGVGATIAKLIEESIVPGIEKGAPNNNYEIFACKRGNYEAYLKFETSDGKIFMTGTEVNNGARKTASYTFPITVVTGPNNANLQVQGEAIAFANLMKEIGAGNEMPVHMRQYNQAVKDNIPAGGYGNNSGAQNNHSAQPMSGWSPS